MVDGGRTMDAKSPVRGPDTRYRSLDGLRGLAAFTVLISHFSNQTNLFDRLFGWGGGQLGVMLFFCLSGFLMARLYIGEPATAANVGSFFRRRAARVVPLYLVVVLASYAWTKTHGVGWPAYAVTDDNLAKHLLMWRGTDALWTIPVEIQFYLLFPVFWIVGRLSRPTLVFMIAALIVAIVVLRFPEVPIVARYLPFFLAGLAVSLVPARPDLPGIRYLFFGCLALYVLSFPQVLKTLGLSPPSLIESDEASAPWFSPPYLILIPSLLWLSLSAPVAQWVLANRMAVYAGTISYSTYLLHDPLLHALDTIPLLKANVWLFLPVFIAGIFSVASLSYFLIESPLRSLLSGRQLYALKLQSQSQPHQTLG
jgi:peptidoglycan/LPS O-acetylase OafA/YrhL